MPQVGNKYPGSQSVSGQTGLNIVTRVRALLNESTASFWSDTQILEWVNNACMDIVSHTWCLGATENITLVNSTLEYPIISNYITVATVHLYDNNVPKKVLLKGHPAMFGHVPDPGEPVYWYEFDSKMGVYPMMAAVGSKSLKLLLVIPPAIIGMGEPLPIPQYFDDAVVKYACAMGLFRDNELQTAQATLQNYQQQIDAYTNDLLSKPANEINDLKAK